MFHDTTKRLGRILGITSLLVLVETTSSFRPKAGSSTPPSPPKIEGELLTSFDVHDALDILSSSKEAFDADTVADIDLDAARDYASHFGKYPYEEIEHMRDGKPLKVCYLTNVLSLFWNAQASTRFDFLSLDVVLISTSMLYFDVVFVLVVRNIQIDLQAHLFQNDSPSDVLFLERILEDELSSQLLALEEKMPDPYLFRHPDREVGIFSGTDSTSQTTDQKGLDKYKQLVGEGVLESLVMCVVLCLLTMNPQHFF